MYIVVYEDRFGCVLHGETSSPWHLLFMLVHTGVLGDTEKKAKKRALASKIFPITTQPTFLASKLVSVSMSVG